MDRSSAATPSRENAALEALRTLVSVPLTWHPRGEAEQRSFEATMAAYTKARMILGI